MILHQLFRKQEFAWSFHSIPPVDLYVHVEKHLNMVKAAYDKAGVTLILYADGCANPGKAAEDAERSQHRETKRAKFRTLQRPEEGDPNPSDKEEITQLMKESCHTRQDVLFNVKAWCIKYEVRLIGAPFETDPQEVADEVVHGITGASSTVDSDFFILGSRILIDNLSHSNDSGKCNIIRRDEKLQDAAFGSGGWDIIALACFLGNDFIDRPYGQGEKFVVDTLMPRWTAASEPERTIVLAEIAQTRKWKKSDAGTCTDYAEKFWIAYNLFRYAPHFTVNADTGYISLEPMRPYAGSFDQWKDFIGYDPLTVLEQVHGAPIQQARMREMYDMVVWAKTGELLAAVPKPIVNGAEVPYGSVLDFEAVPVEMQPHTLLSTWLECRRLKPPGTEATLVALVNKVLSLGDQAPPIVEPEPQIGDGKYVVWSVVKTVDGMPVVWITGDAMFDVLRNDFFVVTDKSVNEVFGEQRNGIRHRAEICCCGGHIDMSTMKCARVKKAHDDSDVLMLTASVTPTVKTPQYWTTLMVDNSQKYLPCPFSGCDCPAGQLFCSHMLAFLLYVMLVQENKDMTFDDMVAILPPPVLSLQTLPVHFSFVYR